MRFLNSDARAKMRKVLKRVSTLNRRVQLKGANRELRVHIGWGKTGSSTLQSSLARDRDRLKALGIHYYSAPSVAKAAGGEATSGNGTTLFANLSADLSDRSKQYNPRRAQNVVESYFDGHDVSVVSFEKFSTTSPLVLQRLNEICMDLNIDLHIVCVVRNIRPYFESAFLQQMKTGSYNGTFPTFADKQGVRFYQNIRFLAHTLGRDRVQILHYESHRDTLIQALYEILCPVIKPQISPRVNVTPPSEIKFEDDDFARLEEVTRLPIRWLNDNFFEGKPVLKFQ